MACVPSLCQDKGTLAVACRFVWCSLGASCYIKETLLGWHGSFVGKRHKKVREQLHCSSFDFMKTKNRRSFDNEEGQTLKSYFLKNLFLWVKMYIDIGFTSLN